MRMRRLAQVPLPLGRIACRLGNECKRDFSPTIILFALEQRRVTDFRVGFGHVPEPAQIYASSAVTNGRPP
jgi:hypothetical protein